jgi:hypothetical protein
MPGPNRWRKLLETGFYGTIEELSGTEKIDSSYVSASSD